MKKKSLIVLMTVTLVIAAFGLVGPTSAKQPDGGRALFEADIVPATIDGHLLDKGEVYIREDGSFKVEIEGAMPDTPYRVFLVFGAPIARIELLDFDDNSLATNEDGEGKLEGDLCPDIEGSFGNPWIEIYSGDARRGTLQFVSGFELECFDE